jgi:hypothetical protein
VFIPVRLPYNAFDLSRSAREVTPPLARQVERKDALGEVASAPQFPPGLRDVGGELDRLLTRLAGTQGRRSRAEVELDRGQVERPSTVTSTGQLNSAQTSYEKVQLSFPGSTSVARLGGTFVGGGMTASATQLRFVIDGNATLGATASPLAFHITDQTGASLYSYSGNTRAGQTIEIGGDIGLSLTFGEGTLVSGQASSTKVFQRVPTSVDADATFGNVDPNLRPRFENGQQVSPGSFTVNGKTITVGADDSINSVLLRLEQEVPDVVAKVEDDLITLSSRGNSRRLIELAADTSGFLAATKLQGATPKPGFVRPEEERLWESQRFASVRDGSFSLGDKIITVDPLTDTLGSVLGRMNDAVPGLAAYYDKQAKRVVVRGGDDTELGDDSSGFLAALGLDGAGELPAREGMMLSPGAAARLERGAAGRQAELVDRTLSALAEGMDESASDSAAAAEEARAAGAKSAAARAKAAYGRDTDDSSEPQPVVFSRARLERAFASAGLGVGLAGLASGPAKPRASGANVLSAGFAATTSATQRGADGGADLSSG